MQIMHNLILRIRDVDYTHMRLLCCISCDLINFFYRVVCAYKICKNNIEQCNNLQLKSIEIGEIKYPRVPSKEYNFY